MASAKSRREALLIGLGLVGVAAGWQVWIRRPRAFEFQDMDGLPGWRMVSSGQVSTGASGNVFAGLDATEPVAPLDPGLLCRTLFEISGPGVPTAVFTDVACPYCRRVAPDLAARASEGRIALNWLEWPIYGRPSEDVARALIAARQIGGEEALRGALYASGTLPLPRAIAQAGLSRERLARVMQEDVVDRRLATTRAAAERLRLPGTPSMMIGRTLVIGAPTPEELDRLIEIEAADAAWPCA